jgi:CBS domain-containing protein
MNVAGILDSKGAEVATVPPDATVANAIAELGRLRIGALVVSADGSAIDGIVSERDVVRSLSVRGEAVLAAEVSSIMSSSVRTCRLEDDVEVLMATMTEHRIRHVPVVEDGVLCGIVSIGDVVKNRIDQLERDRAELVEYINAR